MLQIKCYVLVLLSEVWMLNEVLQLAIYKLHEVDSNVHTKTELLLWRGVTDGPGKSNIENDLGFLSSSIKP